MTTAELADLVDHVADLDSEVGDAERIAQLRLLERLASTAAATRASVTSSFATSQEAEQRAAGVPSKRVGQGIAAQVALARRESPARAANYVGWARVLVAEMPCTLAALRAGETTEWRAMIVARETIRMPERAHREAIDADLGPRLRDLGDRQVEAEARKLAYKLDPHGFVARSRAVAKDRRVTLRPAPDTMARLTALLPVAQGVAAYAALNQAAAGARATGDKRGRGQVMADTLVERVTGQSSADDVDVEIQLVMTDRTMLGDSASGDEHDNEPGVVVGYGPVPAGVARGLARGTAASRSWVRRLFLHPQERQLAAIDARRRCFEGPLREALIARDELCRTPWCGAPIRHGDHVVPVAEGGETTLENGAGLCEACNYAKQAPGWTTAPGPGGTGESIMIATPTGHTYTSRPPDPPGWRAGLAPPSTPPHPDQSDAA